MRTLLFALLALSSLRSSAQFGIRAIPWNFEQVYKGAESTHMGLGVDHDLHERLSIGLDFRSMMGAGFTVEYRSQYHFADNSSSSGYVGTSIGYRSLNREISKTMVPVGIRLGLRGGLQGFYADLHAGAKYQAGGGSCVQTRDQLSDVQLNSLTFFVGLDLGIGWDPR